MATLVDQEFRNIDENKTIENAKRVLNEYRQWRIKASRISFSLQSPSMDGMPKSPSFANSAEDKQASKNNADFMANTVINVIHSIATIDELTETYANILTMLYINRYSNIRCIQELNLSEKTFYRYRRIALLAFATMYPPVVERLLVHKPGDNKKSDSILTVF